MVFIVDVRTNNKLKGK